MALPPDAMPIDTQPVSSLPPDAVPVNQGEIRQRPFRAAGRTRLLTSLMDSLNAKTMEGDYLGAMGEGAKIILASPAEAYQETVNAGSRLAALGATALPGTQNAKVKLDAYTPDIPMEAGDIPSAFGAPEPVAAGIGLAAESVMPGVGELANFTQAARSTVAKSGKALYSGLNWVTNKIAGKHPEEVKWLKARLYEPINKENMNVNGAAVANIAEEAIADTEKLRKEGRAAFQSAYDKVGPTLVPTDKAIPVVQDALTTLSKEPDKVLSEQVLSAPVGGDVTIIRQAVQRPGEMITKTKKTLLPESGTQLDESGIAYTSPYGKLEKSKVLKSTPNEPSKVVKIEETRISKQKAPTTVKALGRDRNVHDVLKDVINGKATFNDMRSAIAALDRIAGPDGKANPVATNLRNTLNASLKDLSPEFADASAKWRNYSIAQEAGDTLYGGVNPANRNRAMSADRMARYFNDVDRGPIKTATENLQAVTGKDYTTRIKDAAATWDLHSPRMSGTSRLSSTVGATALNRGGLNALALTLKNPYVSKFIYNPESKLNKTYRVLFTSPAGKFMLDQSNRRLVAPAVEKGIVNAEVGMAQPQQQ